MALDQCGPGGTSTTEPYVHYRQHPRVGTLRVWWPSADRVAWSAWVDGAYRSDMIEVTPEQALDEAACGDMCRRAAVERINKLLEPEGVHDG